jgi:predicted nucleotidyltransferase
MFPLDQHTMFLTLAGSRAHGTARDGSDIDLRGVCVAPLAVRLSLFHSFEQYEGELPELLAETVRPRLERHPSASRALDIKIECVVFDVAKFVGLCATANPNALEILFADERDWVFETPVWRRLHDERQRFLTKKVQQTFHGYAMAQLKKIKTHRAWLSNPPTNKPSRADFGLQLPPDVVSALNSEKKYRAAMKHWDSYQTWKTDRNPARAELERRHGYDTKHAMHLIRLMRMGLEVLETGDLRVRRDDADQLSAIRDGAMPFDDLLAAAAGLQAAMEQAAAATSLPEAVDRNWVDDLLLALLQAGSP